MKTEQVIILLALTVGYVYSIYKLQDETPTAKQNLMCMFNVFCFGLLRALMVSVTIVNNNNV